MGSAGKEAEAWDGRRRLRVRLVRSELKDKLVADSVCVKSWRRLGLAAAGLVDLLRITSTHQIDRYPSPPVGDTWRAILAP